MAAVADSDSMHENLTRIRMKMVQQKLANERNKLQRPSSTRSSSNGGQIKLQHAMLRRQELLDKIRQEQVQEGERPRSYSPRRRFTPSSIPPPSRRSLPELSRGLSRAYYFNWLHRQPKVVEDMAQTKHVIEHQFRPAEPATHRTYVLPPIRQAPPPPPLPPQITTIQSPPQVIQQVPSVTYVDNGVVRAKEPTPSFKKADFMDMMMMQNAQMHHMVMQQMMLYQLPGGGTAWHVAPAPVPVAPRPVYPSAPAPPVVHHYESLPPLDVRPPPGPVRAYRRPVHHKPHNLPIVVRTDVNRGNRPSSVFLFGIILKEIVAALHRVYLNPNGNIYPVLSDIIGNGAVDLTQLIGDGRRLEDQDRVRSYQILQYVMENLIYHITEIMPKAGVLGTHKKAAVFEMIKSGKRFPDGYFWQIELDRLEFNNHGRTVNVADREAFLLLVGMFLSRSLITTLLMKPVDYGLSTDVLTEVAERNLKVLSTIMLFLVRRASTPRDAPMMPMPGEVARYVYTDEEFRNVHLRLRRSYEYCENLLREWGAEYLKRLREAATNATK